eukprot:1747815-Pleurochrysis_carterae.AAC.3
MGVSQPDGTFPAAVVKADAVLAKCVAVAQGGPARFAIEGKDEHVDMTTYEAMAELYALPGVRKLLSFDQCVADLAVTLAPAFDERFCSGHPVGTHASVVGAPPTEGIYKTRALQAYPPELNAAVAAALLALLATHAWAGENASWRDAPLSSPSVSLQRSVCPRYSPGSRRTVVEASKGRRRPREKWRDAARDEVNIFESHGVKVDMSEDSLQS